MEVFEGGLQGERLPPFREHTRRREVRRRLCVGKRRAAHERRCVCHVVSNLLIRFAAAAALRIPRASRSLLVALRRAASWFFCVFFLSLFSFPQNAPPRGVVNIERTREGGKGEMVVDVLDLLRSSVPFSARPI